MDWQELFSQLDAQLAGLAARGIHHLNIAPDEALAEKLRALAGPPPRVDTAEDAAAPPGGPRGRGARLAAQLRSGGAPSPPQVSPPGSSKVEPSVPPPQGGALEALRLQYQDCTACGLSAARNRVVFGVGHPRPAIMFIGEGPGAEEDQQGLPFVGRAGALLTGLIQALGLTREDVYITNVVKCRPPSNRNPQPGEIAACRTILTRQIEALDPRLIVTLGNVPLKALRPDAGGITRERGRPFPYGNCQVLPTFHPSYLLRSPAAIRTCWMDFKQALHLAYSAPST